MFSTEESQDTALNSIFQKATQEQRTGIRNFFRKFILWIKEKLGKTSYTEQLQMLEDKWINLIKNSEATEETGAVKYDVVNMDNGKSFVKASRRVITTNTLSEMRNQISEFFKKSLKDGPITINTVEGDILTITNDTAKKARDNHATENHITRELSKKEFKVKLNAEAHIDELSEISKAQMDRFGNEKITPDTKKHAFAKNGFSYRTAYFEDFDGSYYKITLSIGENNIATIYNVGQIKADNIPNGNIVSAIGSKADMLSANNSISNNPENVKKKNSISPENIRYNQERYVNWLLNTQYKLNVK